MFAPSIKNWTLLTGLWDSTGDDGQGVSFQVLSVAFDRAARQDRLEAFFTNRAGIRTRSSGEVCWCGCDRLNTDTIYRKILSKAAQPAAAPSAQRDPASPPIHPEWSPPMG